jgi:hypothetical protein
MNVKYLIMVSFILAIVTMCAVSASEDISDNLTADDGVEIQETPVEDIVSSSDDADVSQDDVVSSSDEDLLVTL